MFRVFRPLFASVILTAPAVAADLECRYPVYPVDQPPTIDGQVESDAGWQTIPWSAGFHKLGRNDFRTLKQTAFKMAYDDENLYIAVLCYDPDVHQIEASTEDHSGIWREDCVEVLILPADQEFYRQYLVNPNGARWSLARSAKTGVWVPGTPLDQWQAAAHRGKTFWSIEMAISLDVFDQIPDADTSWLFNVCRSVQTFDSGGDNHTSWSPMRNGYHEVNRYGEMIFQTESLNDERPEDAERRINSDYYRFLRGWADGVASQADRYRQQLQTASQQSALREETQRLLDDLASIEAMAQLPEPKLSQLVSAYSQLVNIENTVSDIEARSFLDDGLFD